MSRSLTDVLAGLLTLLPRGWVWRWARNPASNVARVLSARADAVATLESFAEGLIDEIDPRSALLLLADYERVLGPDPAGRDLTPLTLTQRRQIAFQRWTASPGGQSIAYFVALAAAEGLAITIQEFAPFVAGVARAGTMLISSPQSRIWRVNMPPTVVTQFRAGGSTAGDSLGVIAASLFERVIRLYAPADTWPIFNYAG